MAESSETSLRDAQILDGDGTLANEAANKYPMKARAEAVKKNETGRQLCEKEHWQFHCLDVFQCHAPHMIPQ
jgi:hypothetical protein